jgi:hypothetical protein
VFVDDQIRLVRIDRRASPRIVVIKRMRRNFLDRGFQHSVIARQPATRPRSRDDGSHVGFADRLSQHLCGDNLDSQKLSRLEMQIVE